MNRALCILMAVTILSVSSGCHWFFQHPWFAPYCGGSPYGGPLGGCLHGSFEQCASCLGCGDVHWGDWPTHCDPCDQCGNWIGPNYKNPYPAQSWYDLGATPNHGAGCGCDDCAVIPNEQHLAPVADHFVPHVSAARTRRASHLTANGWYDHGAPNGGPAASRRRPQPTAALAVRQSERRAERDQYVVEAAVVRPARLRSPRAAELAARSAFALRLPPRGVGPSDLRRAAWYTPRGASAAAGARAVAPALHETAVTSHRLPPAAAPSKAHCAVCRREAMLLEAGETR